MTARSTAFFALMALLVLAFAGWGIAQGIAVQQSRAELEQRVGWLSTLQPALPALHNLSEPDGGRQWTEQALRIEALLDEIDAMGVGLDTAPSRAALAGMREQPEVHASDTSTALAALQTDIRDQNRRISVELSRYWSLINVLLAATILLSIVALVQLFVLLRRQTALSLAHAALSGESIRRSRAATALRASEQALSTILESIDEGIITVDEAGRVTRLNAAAERLTGCQRLSVEGAPLGGVVSLFIERRALDLSVSRLRDGLKLYAADGVKLHRADGARLDVSLHSAPLDGRPGALLLLRDITDERVAEEERRQVERTAAISRLVAGISHGLNNPLTALQSNLDGLPVAPGEDESIDEMRAGVAQMILVLRQLAALSRVTPRHLERVDVGVLAEHITRIIAPELLHRTRLQLDLEPVPEIVADRARLEQALLGMVFNAAQSIASGAPEDNTVTLRVAVADGAVEMCVVDTGADMAAERVHVFDPFFPSRGLSEGLGLGLTYAHAEVTALGGTLSVSTADGGGTRIRITLPVAGDTAAAPLPRGLRLLIIDDEVSILKVVQRMLQGRFEIVGVASGAEGLERLRSEAYDLVLCDLMMPSMTGMQLYDILCREQPEVARSMVFMTGGALSESARAFLGAHESVCITKPFTLEDLLTILGRAVEAPAAR